MVYDVNHLLLVFRGSVDLAFVASTQINHDILVPEEKHDSVRIVQVIPFVKVRDSCNILETSAKRLTFSTMLYLLYFYACGVPSSIQKDGQRAVSCGSMCLTAWSSPQHQYHRHSRASRRVR